ncbi:TetR/AcrR family transcriptional regulator [Luteibacter aegosomatissinici]|uniref:TetR/AcrR family transcriptional regulator n=1 Tax=Luteibacter aegosomatissinici TaxID=2911539 RepID=UPI001FFB23C9|nr:TetR/AcrR family transcriptional regulator [Luteibacter aegosomatissinici]UPG96326.1 TetR/AcrR family transcriptional regulator [Luteibacter aegosomatissinici]
MARPREFDRDTALQRAIETFAQHGYEGTSTPMLLDAMKIGRQSLYDTFGDKRALYIEALRTYSEESIGGTLAAMFAHANVLDGIEGALLAFAETATTPGGTACLGIHAVAEFGTTAPDVCEVTAAVGERTLLAFESRLRDGIGRGEIAASLDPPAGAHFLLATLSGLKIAARGGAPNSVLRQIIAVALRSFSPVNIVD